MSAKLITSLVNLNMSELTYTLSITRQSLADYIQDYWITNYKLPLIVSVVELPDENEANQLANFLINKI